MEQKISQKIIRNTIFNTVGHFWGILVALFLTPYIIRHIGVERYGIWAIIGVLTGYFGLLDFGVGTSFVKYIAEFYAKKDYEKISQVINTGFVFYSIFAIVVITLSFFIVKPPLLTFFKIPSYLSSETLFVFLLGIILFCISNAVSPFNAVQNGLQRMSIYNNVAIVVSIPNILGTIFFLEKGYGLPGLMVNNAVILAISSIVNIIIAFKILPELKFSPFLFSKKMFKKLFGFGYKLQVIELSSLAGSQTDKLLITHFLGLGLVTFYQLGDAIVEKAKGVSLLIISALLPAVAELNVKREMAKIKSLYIRSVKYVVLVALPLSFFFIINSRLIILTWMNQDFEKAALSLQILSIGFFINILTGPAAVTLQGIGKPEHQMMLSLFHFFLSLFLSIVLIIKFGFIGVLIGTSLSYFLTGSYFIYSANRLLKIASTEMRKIVFQPLLACIVAALINHYFKYLFNPADLKLDRLFNFSILLGNGFVFGTIVVLILWIIKYFNQEDIALLKNLLSKRIDKVNW